MSEQQTKVCKKCGIDKGLGEYVRGKKHINHQECNKCVNRRKHEQDVWKYNNDPEWKAKYIERKKRWKENNVEAQQAIAKRVNTKQRLSGKASISDKKQTIELTDKYVKNCLTKGFKGLTFADVTPSMVERHRAKIIAKREAKANKSNGL